MYFLSAALCALLATIGFKWQRSFRARVLQYREPVITSVRLYHRAERSRFEKMMDLTSKVDVNREHVVHLSNFEEHAKLRDPRIEIRYNYRGKKLRYVSNECVSFPFEPYKTNRTLLSAHLSLMGTDVTSRVSKYPQILDDPRFPPEWCFPRTHMRAGAHGRLLMSVSETYQSECVFSDENLEFDTSSDAVIVDSGGNESDDSATSPLTRPGSLE